MSNIQALIDVIKKDLVRINRITSINNIINDEEVPLLTIREHPLYQKFLTSRHINGVSKFKSLSNLRVFRNG